jgi:uncharacterized membrane protein
MTGVNIGPGGQLSPRRLLRRAAMGVVLAAMAMASMAPAPASASAGYVPVNLGTLPGGSQSHAAAINAEGTVVGTSNGTGIQYFHATVWKPDRHGDYRAIDLTSGAESVTTASMALAINDSGVIVGVTNINDPFLHPVVWQPTHDGGYRELHLPELSGATDGYANGINDQGTAVGFTYSFTVSDKPTEWVRNGGGYTAIDLSSAPARASAQLEAINELGVVAGFMSGVSFISHAAIWSRASRQGMMVTDLGTLLDGQPSGAQAINEKGVVAGWASNGAGVLPVVWRHAQNGRYSISQLPLPAGIQLGQAAAVNSAGAIAGWLTANYLSAGAALWQPSVRGYSVTALDSGGEATAINDAGVIAGNGGNNTAMATLWRRAR